jgi:hypothetical protein
MGREKTTQLPGGAMGKWMGWKIGKKVKSGKEGKLPCK